MPASTEGGAAMAEDTGGAGKIDAEIGPLTETLQDPNVTLMTGAQVMRLETNADSGRVTTAVIRRNGREERLTGHHFRRGGGGGSDGCAAAPFGEPRTSDRTREPIRPDRPQLHEPKHQ